VPIYLKEQSMDKDTVLFGDKSFADLMKNIYDNTKKKETQITALIDQLKPMIRNMTDASMMVPLIKEYLEVSVKNDDNLVKLTAIIQRLLIANTKTTSGDELGLSEMERAQLMEAAQDLMDKSE
tara:strand:- start:923 stop:1294 length:372 start_codon:yes stop_codon:yes gene_type:complete